MAVQAAASDPRLSIPRDASSITNVSNPNRCASIAVQATQKSGQARQRKHGQGRAASGRPGAIWINPDTREAKRLPTRYADYPLRADDVFRLDTPGGGGYGDPLTRDPERVLADVREGVISRETAERDYGVVLTPSGRSWLLDHGATQARRAEMRAKR